MVQIVNTAFQSPDTSAGLNAKASGVISPGVYQGYRVVPNAGDGATLDIVHGHDATSVLVMPNGLRVEDTEPVKAAFKIDAADASFSRIDLAAVELVGVETPVFRIVKGANQVDPTKEPVVPELPEGWVELARISVKPLSVTGGLTTKLTLDDIDPVPKASWSQLRTSSSCKPEVSPTDHSRLYVYPGNFISVDGTSVISFSGGMSPEIPADTYADGEVRWVRAALTDEGTVVYIGSATTQAGLPDLSNDVFPLAEIKTRKSFGSVVIDEVVDIRYFFDRKQAKSDETDVYRDLLASSVFSSMHVDTLVDASLVDLKSVALDTSGPSTELSAALSTEDTSLTLTYSGDLSVPAEDVTITTVDLLLGGSTPYVNQFMCSADTPFDGLRFRYSTSSASGGFSTNTYALGEIVRIPQGAATQLFIKWVFPRAAFQLLKVAKLYSYAVLFNIDAATLNSATIGDLGVPSLSSNTNNLLANGDFSLWSQYDSTGVAVDAQSLNVHTFAVGDLPGNSGSTEEHVNTADGWQLTGTTSVTGGQVSRVPMTDISLGGVGLELTALPGAGSVHLEQRIQQAGWLAGRTVTAAIEYRTGVAGAVGLGIAVYERTAAGLVLKDKYEVIAPSVEGTLLVETLPLPAYTHELGVYVVYPDTGAAVTTRIWQARAAVGSFGSLPFAPGGDPAHLYARGRCAGAVSASGAPTTLVAAASLRKPMFGNIVVRAVTGGTSLSSGVSDISLTHDNYSVLASAQTSGAGGATLLVSWEVYVRYESSPL